MVMVDGVGLPGRPLSESVYADCPALCELFTDHCVPIDACLGLPGAPQSATGQTAILTGINAAEMLGQHLQGFPGPRLRPVIEEHNLFSKLVRRGKSATFANAYVHYPGQSVPLHLRSVTTVSTLACFGGTRNVRELLEGTAVYHDVTRWTLQSEPDRNIPTITEDVASRQLLTLLQTVDFCLFEYFLTDHVGHRGSAAEKQRVLRSFDAFMGGLMRGLDPDRDLLVLVSDHGNIEYPEARGHSRNAVPWACCGCRATEALAMCQTILDVTPAVLQLLPGE